MFGIEFESGGIGIVEILFRCNILAALLWPRGQAQSVLRQSGLSPKVHPGRALIDHFEEVGRDNAGRLIADGRTMTHRELEEIAEDWRPHRSLALGPLDHPHLARREVLLAGVDAR